jgi:hypothetical protein
MPRYNHGFDVCFSDEVEEFHDEEEMSLAEEAHYQACDKALIVKDWEEAK